MFKRAHRSWLGLVGWILVGGVIAGLLTLGLFHLIYSRQTVGLNTIGGQLPRLAERFIFPDGYHLMIAAGAGTSAEIVFICQSDTDPTDYRRCYPEIMREGE